MVLNPNTPAHIRKAIEQKPESSNTWGWEMNKGICKFTPKYNVGEQVKILVIGNEGTEKKYVDENTKIEYMIGEVTGYYNVGYGITVLKPIYMRNELYGYYQFPSHHTLHRAWIEEYPYDKTIMEAVMKQKTKYRAFVFR